MASCAKCGEEIPGGATTCANCAAAVEAPARPLGLKIILAFLAISILVSLSYLFSMEQHYSYFFGVKIHPTYFKIGGLAQNLVWIYCLYGLIYWKKSGFYALMALYAFSSANALVNMIRIPDMLRTSSGQVDGFAAGITIGAFLIVLGINLTIVIYVYGLKERFVK